MYFIRYFMDKEVRDNIIRILDEGYKAIQDDDALKLRMLSDNTIHDASTKQDNYSISVAVIMFSLHKLFSRISFRTYPNCHMFVEKVLGLLKAMKISLEQDRMKSFDLSVKEFFSLVDRVAGKLKFYIKEVIDTAKISKGSRLYEHGVSLSKTADLLGVSAYELMSYIGKTGIADVDAPLKNTVRKRLSFTRGLFV